MAWNRRYIQSCSPIPGLIQVGRPIEEIIPLQRRAGAVRTGDVEAQVARRVAFMKRGSPMSRAGAPGWRVIEMQGNPMPAGGFVMTFTDITPFRAAERVLREANEHLEARVAERTHELSGAQPPAAAGNQQVEQANQSKSRFLAAVSHDPDPAAQRGQTLTSSLLEMLPRRTEHRPASPVTSTMPWGRPRIHHGSAGHLAPRGEASSRPGSSTSP